MPPRTRSALELIAKLHDGKAYASVTKADLFEALKRARHVAKSEIQHDEAQK